MSSKNREDYVLDLHKRLFDSVKNQYIDDASAGRIELKASVSDLVEDKSLIITWQLHRPEEYEGNHARFINIHCGYEDHDFGHSISQDDPSGLNDVMYQTAVELIIAAINHTQQ